MVTSETNYFYDNQAIPLVGTVGLAVTEAAATAAALRDLMNASGQMSQPDRFAFAQALGAWDTVLADIQKQCRLLQNELAILIARRASVIQRLATTTPDPQSAANLPTKVRVFQSTERGGLG